MAGVTAREAKVVLELVQAGQLVDALGRYPKKTFMDRPEDQARVADRIVTMRKRAGDLSASFRKAHPDAPWDDLESVGRTPEDLWRATKKIVPRMLAVLEPLVADRPEAAFVSAEVRRPPRRRSAAKRS